MKISIIKIFVIVLSIAVTMTATFGAQGSGKGKFRRSQKAVIGEYIVVLKNAPSAQDVSALADNLSRKHNGTTKHKFTRSLSGFSVRLTEQQALALSQDPSVDYVEENGIVEAIDVQYNPSWGLDRIDQRQLPLSSTYDNNGVTGAGVTVYVLDTGIRVTHQDFGGRAYVGADFIGDGLNGNDGNGHGTHVAGTIGGGTYGVAKQVRLCAVRVLDSTGSGTWAQVIAGIDWVTANRTGPSVANMSLGGGASDSVDQAVRNSIASGVTYVVAAGNDNIDAIYKSPARVTEAITIGATDPNDSRAYFSNYGSVVDLFAPGVNITSTWSSSDTATNTIDGTSMACPHVAALVALHLQSAPSDSPADVQTAIVNNATPIGAGRLAYVGNDVNPPDDPRWGNVVGDKINAGTSLRVNDSLLSPNKRYLAIFQQDGNFVVYRTSDMQYLWASFTENRGANLLAMQDDGNLVVYNTWEAPNGYWDYQYNEETGEWESVFVETGGTHTEYYGLWHTATQGYSGNRLVMQDDGNLVIYTQDGRCLWNIGIRG